MLNQLDSHTITVPSTIEQTKIEKLLGHNKKNYLDITNKGLISSLTDES